MTTFRFGRFELRPASRQLLMDGEPVAVGARAFDVLHALVERRERLVTKDELLDLVWPGLLVEENNLQVQISSLRKLLGPAAIATVPARGYKFALEATYVAAAETQVTTSPPRNLPNEVTPFIGRESLLTELKALLTKSRLLTLTGVGGIGKSRLSLRLATEVIGDYPDGVWFVELAPLADGRLVAQTVASVLGIREERGRPLIEALVQRTKNRRLLIVLDNCEHLLRACAELCKLLLGSCAQVKLLTTSREPLHVAGEHCYLVPALTTPNQSTGKSIVSLTQYEAIRLFVGRAGGAQPKFELMEQNAAAVADICRRLDGIPLAIELAAARVRTLSVENIAARLGDRFRLLTSGDHTSLPHLQTLRTSMDWSYDLLSDAERTLLCRLSVFVGGWTLEAAEAVGAGGELNESDVLDLLCHLVEKSLVEFDADVQRYRLLETVRQYARDRLLEKAESAVWPGRHFGYFLSLAEEADPHLRGGVHQKAWLDRMETEHDNLRSALMWYSTTGRDAADGLRLAGALWRFWFMRGYFDEGRGWLSRLLTTVPAEQPKAVRAKALYAAGTFALHQADYLAARALLEESLAIRRELGDSQGVASSLGSLGGVAWEQGDLAAGKTLIEESLAIFRTLHDRRGIAASLANLGDLAFEQDDFAVSQALLEESLAISRELGDKQLIGHSLTLLGELSRAQGEFPVAQAQLGEGFAIAQALGDRRLIAAGLKNLGTVAFEQRDLVSAQRLFGQSLVIQRELSDRREIAKSLHGFACVALALGGPERAARIWGAMERLGEEIDAPLSHKDRSGYDRHLPAARAALGDDAAFDHAWREGRAMTLEQIIEYALTVSEDNASVPRHRVVPIRSSSRRRR